MILEIPLSKQFRDTPYYISQGGDIYRYAKRDRNRTPAHYNLRKTRINNAGYKILNMWGKTTLVHLLVAEAYLGPRPEGMVCNHIDGNKLNNHYTNLEWVTRRANQHHAIGLGLQKYGVGCEPKLGAEQVYQIWNSPDSPIVLSRKYGISYQTICKITGGRGYSNIITHGPIRLNNFGRKFTEDDVRNIRKSKKGCAKLAKRYNCAHKTMREILNRESYRWVM